MSKLIKSLQLGLNQTNKKIKDIDFTFILSTGRTGTNFFEDFFNNNFKQLTSYHEPFPDLFHLGTKVYRQNFDKRRVVALLKHSRRNIINQIHSEKKGHYIESNPFLSYLVPYLEEAFNTPKIIHIVRHPDTYIYSAINKDPNNSGNLFMSDQDHRKRVNANDVKGDEYCGRWGLMSQFERVCWNWAYTNNYIHEQLKNYTSYKLIKYEDFFLSPSIAQLEELLDFIGVTNLSELPKELLVQELSFKRNQSKGRFYNDYEEIKAKNSEFYHTIITKPLLAKFGYNSH